MARSWTVDGGRWRRPRGDTIIDIADAWWVLAGRHHGIGPQPWLCVWNAGRGVLSDADITVFAGPGSWNGDMVVAAGNGGHFDPVWWPSAAENPTPGDRRGAAAPAAVAAAYRSRVRCHLDVGSAAAVLMCVCEPPAAWVPLEHPSDWSDRPTLPQLNAWADRLASGAGSDVPRDWRRRFALLMCRYPEPEQLLGGDAPTAARMVVWGGSRWAGPAEAADWLVAVDSSGAWLARVARPEVVAPLFLAAAGRMAR